MALLHIIGNYVSFYRTLNNKIDLNDIDALNQIWNWVKIIENRNIFNTFYFLIIKKEENAAQAKEKICRVYGEDTLTR